jgi:hypothetical protein
MKAPTFVRIEGTGRRAVAATGCVAVIAYLAMFLLAARMAQYNLWAVMIVIPVLIAITLPLIVHTARRYGDRSVIPLLTAALLVKFIGTALRYIVTFDVYGAADAKQYHKAGTLLAQSFRQGVFVVDVGGRIIGTHFVEIVTGAVYTLTGPTELGGFVVFSWLGYWGLYFFYRAFRLAVPDGDHRRYALLLFFLPSLLFWPSSIGKESWMLFTLGLTALGISRLYAARRGAYALVGLGLLGLIMARPHIAVLVVLAVFAGFIVRPGRSTDLLARSGTKVVGILVLVVVGAIVVANASAFLGVDSFDTNALNQTIKSTSERTGAGDSAFSAPNAQSPTGFPVAVVTVLFRPFPFEARSMTGMIASAEGITLLILCVVSWRRLRTLPKRLIRQPYIMMSMVFTLVFIFAFSSFGNFGILTRERVQLFPFFLVLLCVRSRPRSDDGPPAERTGLLVSAAAGTSDR